MVQTLRNILNALDAADQRRAERGNDLPNAAEKRAMKKMKAFSAKLRAEREKNEKTASPAREN